jgi:D-alanyl-D-alanine carboxypeptidase (penicillin-binding protein 5/6)
MSALFPRASARALAASVAALAILGVPTALGPLPAAWSAPAAAAGVVADPVGGPELAATGTVWHVPVGVPRPPELPAKGYLLADLATGQILVAHDVHRRLLTASTMKVLTALTLLPKLDPNQIYRARRADEAVDGSKVGIVAGSTYTVHDLFLGMMLPSGNDAANALANAAGGVATTVGLMQQEATSLGAADTTVRDPSGLDAPGQRSSAYDLALVTRAAMQREDFRTLVSTKAARFPGKIVNGKRTKGFAIQNHNELLSKYKGAIGVKTGYTEAAKWTYIGAARRDGRTYVVAEMGLSQPGWVPTTRMLDWAFAHGSQATPVGQLVSGADAASTTATASPSAAGAGEALAGALPLDAKSDPARWVGAGGLIAALVIVGALALRAVRRRAGSR